MTGTHRAGHCQVGPGGPWGTWQYLGPGPLRLPATYPTLTIDPTDGTAHITGSQFSATTCVAHIDQLPDGTWAPWWADPANPAGCGTG